MALRMRQGALHEFKLKCTHIFTNINKRVAGGASRGPSSEAAWSHIVSVTFYFSLKFCKSNTAASTVSQKLLKLSGMVNNNPLYPETHICGTAPKGAAIVKNHELGLFLRTRFRSKIYQNHHFRPSLTKIIQQNLFYLVPLKLEQLAHFLYDHFVIV
jgi:hypothetical protein